MKQFLCALILAGCLTVSFTPSKATAQAPVAVTAFRPAQRVVTYLPERRGLFGRRLVYRPVVSYVPPAAVTTTYSPPSPVSTTTYYAPMATVAAAPVTTYYAPSVVAPAPVTTYYAPAAPVATTTYYAPPATMAAAPVTTYYAPPPTTTVLSPVIIDY